MMLSGAFLVSGCSSSGYYQEDIDRLEEQYQSRELEMSELLAEANQKATAAQEAKELAEKAKQDAQANAQQLIDEANRKAEEAQEAKELAEQAKQDAEVEALQLSQLIDEANQKAEEAQKAKELAEQAKKEAEVNAKQANQKAKDILDELDAIKQAEMARKEPKPYKYDYEVIKGNDKFFEPITEKGSFDNSDPLEELVPADGSGAGRGVRTINSSSIVNGVSTIIQASYTTYSNNLSNSGIALVKGDGTLNGRLVNDTLLVYSGKETNINDFKTLTGTANYKGISYIGVIEYNDANYVKDVAEVNLNANFWNKTISGNIVEPKATIVLEETQISDNTVSFTGKASRINKDNSIFDDNQYKGTYEGKFMGEGAKEVAGKVSLTDNFGGKLGAVFNAKKK